MKKFQLPRFRSRVSLLAATCVTIISGAAALAQADFRDTTLPMVEHQLREQSRQLSQMNDVWVANVKGRVEFAIYKLQNASMAASPAVENMHLEHACRAILDERMLLIQAQSEVSFDSKFIEELIEQTFELREALGCRD